MSPNPTDWKFTDPHNAAVFTTRQIVSRTQWIARVSHDEDGAWQFHAESAPNEIDVAIVSLLEIYEIDPAVGELADLPLGWRAERETKKSPWKRTESPNVASR